MSDEDDIVIAPVDGVNAVQAELVQVPEYVGVELSLAGWFVGKTSAINLRDEDPFGGPCVVRWWVAAVFWRMCAAQQIHWTAELLHTPRMKLERAEALRYVAAAKEMRGAAETIGRLRGLADTARTPEEQRPCKHRDRGEHPLDAIVEAALLVARAKLPVRMPSDD